LRSDAEWKLLPKGYTLQEDMIAGDIDTARKTLEKLEIQKATIEAQDNALRMLEQEMRSINEDLAKAQIDLKLLPQKLAEENRLAQTNAKTKGLIIGVLVTAAIALLVGDRSENARGYHIS
jgi:vancomycin resistance protein YoaR